MATPVERLFLRNTFADHPLSFRIWLPSQTRLCVRIHREVKNYRFPGLVSDILKFDSPGMGKGIVFAITPQGSQMLSMFETHWPRVPVSCLLLMSCCSWVQQRALHTSGPENVVPRPAASISTSWVLVRNANFQAHPRMTESVSGRSSAKHEKDGDSSKIGENDREEKRKTRKKRRSPSVCGTWISLLVSLDSWRQQAR